MHLATSFRSRMLGKPGDCPVAEAMFEQYVSLPIHPRLTDEAVAYMIGAIKQLSQRPHTSLYEQKGATPTPASPADNEWEDFKSEVQTAARDSLFSPAVPITAARAPGRLDLMGIMHFTFFIM